MKTLIVIEVEHDKPIVELADKVAGRAYTLDGVKDAIGWIHNETVAELQRAGFSLAEISLGSQEVVR